MKKSANKKVKSKAAASSQKSGLDLSLVQTVVDFMKTNELVELDVKVAGAEVRLRRAETGVVASKVAAPVVHAPAPVAAAPQAPATSNGSVNPGYLVKSPFVGTFYRSPGPNQESFVEEGKTVSAGDPLCIVEAMKLMHEIESDIKGRVRKVLVKNATPVEFGEPLFELDPL